MIIALFLLSLGLLLIFLEFFFPGAILGILGALLLITSIIVFAFKVMLGWAVILFMAAIVVCIVLVVKLALRKIKSAPPNKNLYLGGNQKGYSASEYPSHLLGKRGIVLNDLKPSGYIQVEGQLWQVTCDSGFLEKGSEVEVIGGEGAHLIVKPVKKDDSNAQTIT